MVFFCFLFNNKNKRLQVFLDSEKIFNKVIEKHLDSFVIEKDYLEHERFGESGELSGQFTDLNIWSKILNDEDIKEHYSCEDIFKVPDVLEWKTAELVLGLMEREVHPCFEHKNHKSEQMIYSVKISMEPKNRAVRTCNALGGIMKVPENNWKGP